MRRPFAFLGTPGGRFVVPGVALLGIAALAAAGWLATRPAEPLAVEVVQSGLEHPWDLAFAPDGRMLVTERGGRFLVFATAAAGASLRAEVTVPDVRAELESGLMGIAVRGTDVFVCASRDPGGDGGEPWRIDLLHATLGSGGELSAFEPMPLAPTLGGPRHQGCAVEIGPDEHLWLTIGDANLPSGSNPAQDPATLNGSVVRLARDGSVPADAPFASGAFTIGHRNPQGIAFTDDGRVVVVEHGTDVNDELNLAVPGGNYGYPCVTGFGDPGPIPDACRPGAELLDPAWASGDPTLATSGIAVLRGDAWRDWAGDLVVTTLKEEDLRRFAVSGDGTVSAAGVLLDGRFGRLRAAVIGPDGALYLSTANGTDDLILRITRPPR